MTDCYQCIEFGYDPDCHCQYPDPVYGTKHHTRRYQRGEHVMNSNEAKVMRRLQSETGLTEVEIREHKKYRVLLSEAQTKQGNTNRGIKEAQRLLKRVTRALKLAKHHPDTIAAAMKSAEEYDNNRWYRVYLPQQMTHYMRELLRSK